MSPNDNRKLSEKYFKELEDLELKEELKYSLQLLINLWRDLSKNIKEIEEKLKVR